MNEAETSAASCWRVWRKLRLKYRDSIADAVADLGQSEEIGQAFAGFRKDLYQESA